MNGAGRRFAAALAGLVALLAVMALPAPARARLGPVIARYGKWSVHRGADLLSDRTVCLATYQGDSRLQLYDTALYVKLSEGPRAYRYRIDDDPVSPMITARAATWHSRIIELGGAAFNRLVTAHRLRLRVTTQRFSAYHVSELDVDLDGIYNAYSAIYHCR